MGNDIDVNKSNIICGVYLCKRGPIVYRPPGQVGDLNSPVLVSAKTEKFAVTHIIIKNK